MKKPNSCLIYRKYAVVVAVLCISVLDLNVRYLLVYILLLLSLAEFSNVHTMKCNGLVVVVKMKLKVSYSFHKIRIDQNCTLN